MKSPLVISLLTTPVLFAIVAASPVAQICVSNVYADAKSEKGGKVVTTSSGLSYIDTQVGTGTEAQKGKLVSVHYTGWLDENGAKGKKFDSSKDRNSPFQFALGAGMVIAGWEEGVAGMKVGGSRTLMIPPDLGYGARGAGGAIPPNAKLIFEVELLDVK